MPVEKKKLIVLIFTKYFAINKLQFILIWHAEIASLNFTALSDRNYINPGPLFTSMALFRPFERRAYKD